MKKAGLPLGGPAFFLWCSRTWCTKVRKPLSFRRLCTKFEAGFGAVCKKTWCTKARKPLSFRQLCTKSGTEFGAVCEKTWCTKSRDPLSFRRLCTKSEAGFGAACEKTWCTKTRKPLSFRRLCTKSEAGFDYSAKARSKTFSACFKCSSVMVSGGSKRTFSPAGPAVMQRTPFSRHSLTISDAFLEAGVMAIISP